MVQIGNPADTFGGAIYIMAGNLDITDTAITGGEAIYGGGIANEGSIVINNSSITGNNADTGGGGIYNMGGEVELNNTTVSDNTAYTDGGGVFNVGMLAVNQSTISGNVADTWDGAVPSYTPVSYGGGISNLGMLTVSRSTISDNEARSWEGSYGGGIYNDNNMSIADSTISGNISHRESIAAGGGGGQGGGAYTTTPATLVNTTLSGNIASSRYGEGAAIYGPATLINSTVTNNISSTYLSNYAAVTGATLHNSIVAGNTGNQDIDAVDPSSSYNVIGVYDGSTISDGVNGNQVGTSASPLDAMLDLLDNNGGPTLTHALLTGSPAIDAGSNAVATGAGLTDDQRGAARSIDGDSDNIADVDVGAVEMTQYAIEFTSIAPAIDDQIDGLWNVTDDETVSRLVWGTVDNAADLSATWKARWDDTNLYVLVEVTDDVLVNEGGLPWNDDIVEIYIDPDNAGGTTYNNDFQYGFRVDDTVVYTGDNSLPDTTGVVFTTTHTAGGWRLEALLPWSTIGVGITPAEFHLMGFDVHVGDDDDGGNRDGKMTWNAPTDTSHYDPSTFGVVHLAGELGLPTDLIVSTLDDNLDGDYSFGELSLREALFIADMNADPDAVTFDSSIENGTIVLDSGLGQLVVNTDVTIDGSNVTLDADQNSRILSIGPSATVSITDMNFINGLAADGGGAIYTQGDLTLSQTDFANHIAGGPLSQLPPNEALGGAILSTGILHIQHANFDNNLAYSLSNTRGGAIYAEGELTLSSVDFTGNHVETDWSGGPREGYGGALYFAGNDLAISYSDFVSNTASVKSGSGGAVALAGSGDQQITGSNFTNNAISQIGNPNVVFGGALALLSGELNIDSNTQFTTNSAMFGGAVYAAAAATLAMTGGGFTGNEAESYMDLEEAGGAIYNTGNMTLDGASLQNNTAYVRGGGIYNSGTLTLNLVTMDQNVTDSWDGMTPSVTPVTYGGAIYNMGTLAISQSTLSNNTARSWDGSLGGAIYNEGGLNVSDSSLTGNESERIDTGPGGGIGVKLSAPFFNLFQHVFLNIKHGIILVVQAFERGSS